ncbi:MAG: hypothetical protein R3E53_19715 [Myxococcota bacterium]
MPARGEPGQAEEQPALVRVEDDQQRVALHRPPALVDLSVRLAVDEHGEGLRASLAQSSTPISSPSGRSQTTSFVAPPPPAKSAAPPEDRIVAPQRKHAPGEFEQCNAPPASSAQSSHAISLS